jgi:hypothetical protein
MTEPVPASTIDHLEAAEPRHVRRLQALHLATTVVLVVIVALGVLDGLGVVPAYGVDTARATASGGGYELEVEYATLSRPALATPFTITVRRDEGFDAPVELAITRSTSRSSTRTDSPLRRRRRRRWVTPCSGSSTRRTATR